jgi:RHS repeat-associated protein
MMDFGSCSSAQRPTPSWEFTGKERDAETGLDYFGARYMNPAEGRFMSPDPTLKSVNGLNPQTWNRYSYVMNNPLRFIDPLGLWAIDYEDEPDKKGKIKHRNIIVKKSKDGDDAASLAKQLGFKGKDAEKLAAQISKTFGDAGSLQLSKMSNIIGRTFGAAEAGLTEQANYDAKGGGKTAGPQSLLYNDCSMTTMRIAAPSIMGGVVGDYSVRQANDHITRLGLNSVSQDDLRTGDIIHWAGGKGTSGEHFSNMLFTGDDETTKAFSRSGQNGRFEIVPVTDIQGYGHVDKMYRPKE